MEGLLTMPPDRGAILGRAQWKARYVRVGKPPETQQQQKQQSMSSLRSQRNCIISPESLLPPVDSVFLAVYRSKDDTEPLHLHAISLIHECQIQMLAHRKQAPEPTLVITMLPDPALDKARKRRSSRTAGLGSTKDSGPPTLWFRSGPVTGDVDSQPLQGQAPTLPQPKKDPSLYEWMRFIQRLVQPSVPDGLMTPMSPMIGPATPVTPTFINPFGSRQRGPSDPSRPRPGSRNSAHAAALHQSFKMSSVSQATYASVPATGGRERPMTFSAADSPSLRSQRSDLSSQASSLGHQAVAMPLSQPLPHQPTSVTLGGFRHINTSIMMGPRPGSASERTAKYPADLPSPTSTDLGELPESWLSSHGRRPSVIGSAPSTRAGRESIGSQGAPASPPIAALSQSTASSPAPPTVGTFPNPRETILDRAFQLRCIPGAERETPGEEKLSSLVRFEALMAEIDEKRRFEARQADEAKERARAAKETARRLQAAATTAPRKISRNHRRRPDGSMDSGLRSVWDLDAESSTDSASIDGGGVDDADGGDYDDDNGVDPGVAAPVYGLDSALEEQFAKMIPPTAQRALEFIAGRRPSHGRSPSALSFGQEAMSILSSSAGSASTMARPQTSRGYTAPVDGRQFRAQAQQVSSQQPPRQHQQQRSDGTPGVPLPRNASQSQVSSSLRITSTSFPPPPAPLVASPISAPEDGGRVPSAHSHLASPHSRKRQSPRAGGAVAGAEKSEKRLSSSFSEFAKRLSGTGSMLLTQDGMSNSEVDGASPRHRQQAEQAAEQQTDRQGLQAWARSSSSRHLHRRRQQASGDAPTIPGDRADRDGCGWRGSVGMFGADEGGFI